MRVKVGYFSLLEISASEHLKKNSSRMLWVAPAEVKYGMYYLYEIMALFLDPATIASVLQLGPSGPINPATSLEANAQWINLASFLNMTFFYYLQIRSTMASVDLFCFPSVSTYTKSSLTEGNKQEQLLICSMA